VFETLKLNEVTDPKYADVQNPTYAIGYMWGTMGLIYNAQVLGADGNAKYNDEDFTNWSNLLDSKFKNKITIKDSLRDSYILAVAIVHEQTLLEYKEKFESGTMSEQEYKDAIFSTFNDVSPETIEKVEQTLMALKSNLYGFEVDAGKNDLLTGKIDVNFAWSGDAVFSMWEADDFGTELRYVVPEEGSNVWFDGFVMTKNADVESSLKFLDFICNPEIAVRNIDYVGYTSCISGDASNTAIFDYVLDSFDAEYLPEATLTIEEYEALKDEEKEDYVPFDGGYTLSDDGYGRIVYAGQTPYIDYFTLNEDGTENITERAEIYEVDLKYFFDPSNTTGDYIVRTAETNRHLYAQYADEETIRRCAVMDNFSNESLILVNQMWSKVKLITLSDLVIILIVIGIALAIGGVVVYKYRDKIFGVIISNKERKIKKGLKVVKKENII
jgi:spermidine/putrescine-binding protein